MTTLETEQLGTDDPSHRVAVRKYSAALTPGDGRTVDMRIVPYGERIEVDDGLGGVPRGVGYFEEFVPGVFDRHIGAAHRVWLDVEHEPGIAGVIGHGVSVEDRADGFHGSFRVLDGAAGDTALQLVRAGSLTGASVECRFHGKDTKSIRGADGVVRRVKAILTRVALCREPAYPGAVVFGVRTAGVEVDDEDTLEFAEEFRPVPFDPDLGRRIEALGLILPPRLADTSQADTSSADDTSESTPPNGDDNPSTSEVASDRSGDSSPAPH